MKRTKLNTQPFIQFEREKISNDLLEILKKVKEGITSKEKAQMQVAFLIDYSFGISRSYFKGVSFEETTNFFIETALGLEKGTLTLTSWLEVIPK